MHATKTRTPSRNCSTRRPSGSASSASSNGRSRSRATSSPKAIDRGEVYVVEGEDDEPVATLALLQDDPQYWGDRPQDALYLHKFAVRRDRAGRGIGAAVVEWANAEAAEAGREFLRLDCLCDNPRIRDYYEDLGFEHRGDLVLNGRNMSLYERPVR